MSRNVLRSTSKAWRKARDAQEAGEKHRHWQAQWDALETEIARRECEDIERFANALQKIVVLLAVFAVFAISHTW